MADMASVETVIREGAMVEATVEVMGVAVAVAVVVMGIIRTRTRPPRLVAQPRKAPQGHREDRT